MKTASGGQGQWSEAADALFARIGAALRESGLAPTPAHYARIHSLLTGDAASSVNASPVRQGASDGKLLSELASRTVTSLDAVADILLRSEAETRAFGKQLEATLDPHALASALPESLVAATRSMAMRMRALERELDAKRDELGELHDRLAQATRQAETDALTQLPNRRSLDARLREALGTARERGTPLSLAICDIDHFKAVNDRFGHHIGDLVLQAVAQTLTERQGQNAFVARFGGEEFVVLFESLDAAVAAERVDAVRDFLSRRSWSLTETAQKLGRITFSAGVAQLAGREGAAALIKKADAALYEAKRGGRDRICIAA